MLTSVAYTPGRVPAIQQQFVSVCLPHTIFTLYVKTSHPAWAPSFSRNGCGRLPALERVCFLAISTSVKSLWGDERHARVSAIPPHSDAYKQKIEKEG